MAAAGGAGLLAGLRLAVKDNIDGAGWVNGSGTPGWAEGRAAAEVDAPVLAALLAEGAQMVGRTVMDELAFSLMGRNAHYGTPPNGAAPERLPGGSSSGSAAAVSCGAADIALGTDTGGSVRLPAAWCGLHGLRTTHGAVPMAGVTPLAPSFDVVGWFARSAVHMAAVAQVCGLARRGGFARVWMPGALWAGAAPALREAAERIVAGRAVEDAPLPECGMDRGEVFRQVQAVEAWAALGDFVTARGAGLAPDVRARFEAGRDMAPADYEAAVAARARFAAAMEEALAGDTLLLMPTTPDPAPMRDAAPEVLDRTRGRAIGLLSVAGLAGLPQYALPVPNPDGPPLSLSLIAAPGRDADLIEIAEDMEP
ncbi:amidase [Vannielia sp. SX4]|uniref:amidase n=1 Tax=Vannielia sp. SX4 TaxID=3463852 RepID=UPI00405A2F40